MNKKTGITIAVILAIIVIGVIVYMSSDSVKEATVENTGGVASSDDMADTDHTAATTTTVASSTKTTTGATVNVGATVGVEKKFTVTGSNFAFSPAKMTVKKGDTVTITFVNSGGMHDLRIDEFNAKTSVIQGGKQETITFVADKAGSFEYYCSVGNHRAMGMKGTLVVE